MIEGAGYFLYDKTPGYGLPFLLRATTIHLAPCWIQPSVSRKPTRYFASRGGDSPLPVNITEAISLSCKNTPTPKITDYSGGQTSDRLAGRLFSTDGFFRKACLFKPEYHVHRATALFKVLLRIFYAVGISKQQWWQRILYFRLIYYVLKKYLKSPIIVMYYITFAIENFSIHIYSPKVQLVKSSKGESACPWGNCKYLH
jgi:hypothetical protein